MQVSFLKDLVTMRNPTSPYSFVSYLQAKGRLADFINNKTLYPFRTEFHDYLQWTAQHFESMVSYGSEVTAIRPVTSDGAITHLDVTVQTGPDQVSVHRARNVVIGAGLVPRLPDDVVPGARVWHSAGLLAEVASLSESKPGSFAVLGAGQSAAEVAQYLHQTFPAADVHAIFSRYGYSVADDSPFANRIFDPAAVDDFFAAPDSVKEDLLRYHSGTNYAVVDLDLTRELY
jgi:L-ornithine N5-oxygenase